MPAAIVVQNPKAVHDAQQRTVRLPNATPATPAADPGMR